MRFLVALISASALLASLSAVRAEAPADRTVQLLNDVCISPTAPEGMIDAGNRFAAAEGWKLVGSGPAPLPIMHNEDGPKISFQSGWEVGLPDGSQAALHISIVHPELPGVRHSTCVIAPAVAIEPDVLGRALEQRLGSLIIKDRRIGMVRGNGSLLRRASTELRSANHTVRAKYAIAVVCR